MPYKRRDDEILVDPVAVLGEEPAPAPFLRPGPAPEAFEAEAAHQALTPEQQAEVHEQVMAKVFAAMAPKPEPVPDYAVPDEVQAEIDRLAAIAPLPASMLQPVSFNDEPDEPTLVTSGVEDCTSCGHPNPEGQKFCGECGARVEKIPKWSCGHDNPDAAKFCGECGTRAFTAAQPTMVQLDQADHAVTTASRPKPAHLLSPAELKERERQHAEAVRLGTALPEVEPQAPQTSNTVLIHFLEDGMTFAGQVWFRGQEIELDTSSARYLEQAQYWIHLTDFEQMDRYGKIMFRQGPWPGKRYTDALTMGRSVSLNPLGGDGARIEGPSAQELAMAEQMEARRRRGVSPMPRF